MSRPLQLTAHWPLLVPALCHLREPRNMPLRFLGLFTRTGRTRSLCRSLPSASSFLGIHMRCSLMAPLTTRSLPLTALYFLLSWHQCLSHMRYLLTEHAMKASGLALSGLVWPPFLPRTKHGSQHGLSKISMFARHGAALL